MYGHIGGLISHLLRFKVTGVSWGTEINGVAAVALQLSFQALPLHAHEFINVSLSCCIPCKLPFVSITFGLVPLTCLRASLEPSLHSLALSSHF